MRRTGAMLVAAMAAMAGCSFDGQGFAADASASDASRTDASTATDAAQPDSTPAAIAAFLEGEGGYVGTLDTTLDEGAPQISFGSLPSTVSDKSNMGTEQWALLRFQDVFTPVGPVPTGADIVSATLTLEVLDPGQDLQLHDAQVSWDETTTWSDIGQPTAGADFRAEATAVVPGVVGSQTVNVTASVVRWAQAPETNLGWFFESTGGNGVDIASRESATPPRLEVVYNSF